MGSLLILAGATVVAFLLTAWILARTAKWAGSSRGRLRFGALAVFAIQAAALVLFALEALLRNVLPRLNLAWSLGYLLALLLLIFAILRLVFALKWKQVLLLYAIFIGVLVLQSAFTTYVLKPRWTEAFRANSRSMSPTIEFGDAFLVNKLVRPKRWDLVVYRDTIDWKTGPDVFCKRLVGLPGEQILFMDGDLYVNNQRVDAPAAIAGKLHMSDTDRAHYPWKYDETQRVTLAMDECFLIGDNVSQSIDSRILGPRQYSSIIGVVDAIYWPPNRVKIIH